MAGASVPPSRWIVATPDPIAVAAVAAGAGVPTAVAAALVNRGIADAEAARRFLNPALGQLNDPWAMKDMDRAVDRVIRAVRSGESVCIYGDYDADGMTSTALLADVLRGVGCELRTFVPDRMRDGYGLHPDRLRELAGEGVTLFVTVDCGVRAVDEVRAAREAGADVVVLDHHEPGEVLPDAAAVVNPHRADCAFPFKDLCAVGVAFYFAGALRRALVREGLLADGALDVRPLLDLVAVGTVADVVPLLGDNRVLVHAGLKRLNEQPRVGLQALKAVAEQPGAVTAGTVGYHLAPRLNATGRVSDPRASLDLLMARDPEEAKRHADVLNRENDARRVLEARVVEAAKAQVEAAGGPQHRAIVAWGDGWHPGVVGIAASKLVEAYRRPAIVLGVEDGVAKGSARSVRGFDLGRALEALAPMLIRFGGHPMAAGLAVEADRVAEFAQAFGELADREVPEDALIPTLFADARLTPAGLDRGLADALARLAPYGIGNPEPTYVMTGVRLREARRCGRELTHLLVSVEDEGSPAGGIWFGGAGAEWAPGTRVDVAFSVLVDEKGGGARMRVRAMRPAAEEGAAVAAAAPGPVAGSSMEQSP